MRSHIREIVSGGFVRRMAVGALGLVCRQAAMKLELPSLFGLLAFCSVQIAFGADIRVTPHNLAQQGSGVDAEEVCVFCHTPQLPKELEGAASGVAVQPAWQPSLENGHAYIMFDDIGRRQFGKQAIGSQSIACLSCHDSNQAFQVTASQSDHPFGIPYRGFARSWDRTAKDESATKDGVFRSARFLTYLDEFRRPSKGMVENRSVWWVSAAGVSAVRTRSDLPLYARQGDGGEIPYVECSSCHDPHIARPLFLRVSNDGSKLCLTCHDK